MDGESWTGVVTKVKVRKLMGNGSKKERSWKWERERGNAECVRLFVK